MPTFRKKTYKKGERRKSFTGEDVAMLRDAKNEGVLRANSPKYKDDIDGA